MIGRPLRKRRRRGNLRRNVIALLLALMGIIVFAPLLARFAGVDNREEPFLLSLFEPTRAAKTRQARTPLPPTAVATLAPEPTLPGEHSLPELTPEPEGPPPLPAAINGVPVNQIVVVTDAALTHLRDIYARGQANELNPRAFAKVGDSTMIYPFFMGKFDTVVYRLGAFRALQPTIDYYRGSFARVSFAVAKGMHTWNQFDPAWANPDICLPDETPLACEFRLHRPSIALIRLGANDTYDPASFRTFLRRIVQFSLDRGVIPVLGTKPDQQEGASDLLNNIVRQTAAEYNIPLWDYARIVETIPGRGLEPDGVHMLGGGTHDFNSPRALASGDSLQDLTALIMLDVLRQAIGEGEPLSP